MTKNIIIKIKKSL